MQTGIRQLGDLTHKQAIIVGAVMIVI